MHRDPTLRARNALVIPGVLLILLCLSGIVYAQALRSDDTQCEDGRLVVFAGACRSATLLLAIPLALGVLLAGLGAAKRSKTTCHLGHGTAATTVLSVLIALAAVPLLATLYLAATEDDAEPYVMSIGGVEYGEVRLLGAVTLVMAVALVPYAALFFATGRPPKCCRQKGCFEPCFCDEGDVAPPAAPPQILSAPLAANETAEVTTTPWTGSTHVQPRAAPLRLPPAAPAAVPEPVPEPAPVAPEPVAEAAAPEAPMMSEMPADEPLEVEEPEAAARTTKPRKSAPKTRKVAGKKPSK